MSSEIENVTQAHHSYTETKELRHRQKLEMDSLITTFPPMRLRLVQ